MFATSFNPRSASYRSYDFAQVSLALLHKFLTLALLHKFLNSFAPSTSNVQIGAICLSNVL